MFPGPLHGKETDLPSTGKNLSLGFSSSPITPGKDNPHGQRILVGYSSQGCKESDMTEQLTP